MKCKHSECNRQAISKECCDMHYRRILKNGSMYESGSKNVALGNEVQRFHQKYDINSNDCWIWNGGTRANGKGVPYGRHWIDDGKSIGSHRFSYELFNGKIPNGMYVCHSCDMPLCVNPAHLFIGSHKENMADMVAKNRSYKGRGENKNGLAKLTNKQAKEIRESILSQSRLGEIYGVSQTTIGRIKRGVSY